MIDKKLKRDDLIGMRCKAMRRLENRGGQGLSQGTICTIKDVVRGHGITIQTDRCPHCGQYAYVTHVSRNDLELMQEELRRLRAEQETVAEESVGQ